MPRFKGAPNTISTDLYIPAGGDVMEALNSPRNAYLVGAAGPSIALFIAAIVFIICYTFAYLCACCRCCCGRCGNSTPVKRSAKTGVHIVMVLLAAVNLGLILSGIAALPGFQKGIDGLMDGTAQATGVLGKASDLLTSVSGSGNFTFTKLDGSTVTTTSVAQSLALARTDAGTMLSSAQSTPIGSGSTDNVCPSNPATIRGGSYSDLDNFCAALVALATNLDAASTTSAGAAAPLRSASTQFESISTRLPLETVKSQVFLAGVIVLAVIAGVIAIQSVLLCRSWCACCMFKGFAWVSVVLTALVFVLAGLFFIIGLPGSDVCYAPGFTLNNLVGGMDPTKTLPYYLTCAGSAADLPDAIKSIASAQGSLGLAQGNITALTDAATAISTAYSINFDASFNTSKTDIITHLPTANNSISLLLSDVVSCPSISGIFDTFYAGLVRIYHPLPAHPGTLHAPSPLYPPPPSAPPPSSLQCGGFITSSITLASVLTAAAALLVLQLSLGVEICCRHPGDAPRWEEPQAAEGASQPKMNIRDAKGHLQPVSINAGYGV